MTLKKFPNEYVDILLDIIEKNPDTYKFISKKANGKANTDIEIEGIAQLFDILALGIRIGKAYSQKQFEMHTYKN